MAKSRILYWPGVGLVAPVTHAKLVYLEDGRTLHEYINGDSPDEGITFESLPGDGRVQRPATTDYCVIMMYGQSLSIGQETPAGFKEDAVENALMLDGGVHTVEAETLVPLMTGTGVNTYGDIMAGYQDPVVSAVKSFVNMYHQARPWDKTKFIAISLGVGGRAQSNFHSASRMPWASNHYLDTRVSPCFDALKAIADAEGKTISLSAVIWCQGETDYGGAWINDTYEQWAARQVDAMQGSYDAYYQGLRYLKDDIYALAQTKFGATQVAPPAFLCYSIGGQWIGNAKLSINMATVKMADSDDDTMLVGPNYCVPDYQAGHLSMNGYRWYGEFIGRALFNQFLGDYKEQPLRPVDFSIDGNKLTVTFNKGRLCFDTYTTNPVPNYGFVVRQGTAAQIDGAKENNTTYNVEITSVEIGADERTVVITCAVPLDGEAVDVIYAGNCGDFVGNEKGSGNLRDKTRWVSLTRYMNDAGDHGNLAATHSWVSRLATAEEQQTVATWVEGQTYGYLDEVLYTWHNNVYFCVSQMDENTTLPINADGGNSYTAWYPVPADATAVAFDEDVLETTGYAYHQKVLINVIQSATPICLQSRVGGSSGGNKVYPYKTVSYRPVDKDGNSIVGQRYPMHDWCINFYHRVR